jgi:hypothetical protein
MDEGDRCRRSTGNAALFVLVRKVTTDKVLEGLKGEGGTVLKPSLDHTKEAALQAALAGVQAAVPFPSPAKGQEETLFERLQRFLATARVACPPSPNALRWRNVVGNRGDNHW